MPGNQVLWKECFKHQFSCLFSVHKQRNHPVLIASVAVNKKSSKPAITGFKVGF